jgi:hypothetical protein
MLTASRPCGFLPLPRYGDIWPFFAHGCGLIATVDRTDRCSSMTKGFVYVLSNQALTGLVKIGYTIKVPDARAVELEGTGVPAPFVVEYYCLVKDAPIIEASVHELLGPQGFSSGREFFKVSVSQAIDAIESCASEREHSWRLTPVATLPQNSTNGCPLAAPCPSCGASYAFAVYCPKCRVKITRSMS